MQNSKDNDGVWVTLPSGYNTWVGLGPVERRRSNMNVVKAMFNQGYRIIGNHCC